MVSASDSSPQPTPLSCKRRGGARVILPLSTWVLLAWGERILSRKGADHCGSMTSHIHCSSMMLFYFRMRILEGYRRPKPVEQVVSPHGPTHLLKIQPLPSYGSTFMGACAKMCGWMVFAATVPNLLPADGAPQLFAKTASSTPRGVPNLQAYRAAKTRRVAVSQIHGWNRP